MKNKKALKTIVILGAPRSGTSMTAGILSRMGVDLGRLRKPDPENPTGYYEDWDFLKLMDNIFREVDEDANGFNPPSREGIISQKSKFDGQIRDLIQDRMTHTSSNVWGWKATTTSFTIDLFREHLINPHFVVAMRNPLGRADSIVKYTHNKPMYNELSQLQALALANRYYCQIYRFLMANSRYPTLFVSFEDTIANPLKTVEDMKNFLGLKLDESMARNVVQFVSPRAEMKEIKNDMRKKERRKRRLNKLRRLFGMITLGRPHS